MLGEIEERVQLHVEDAKGQETLTHRRYNNKNTMLCLLSPTGFGDAGIADGYSMSDLHELRDGEQTASSVAVVAKKP
jgi:hypothetical protein